MLGAGGPRQRRWSLLSRLSAGNPCLELLAQEPIVVERERDEPLQLEDRSLSVLFLGGGGGPASSERDWLGEEWLCWLYKHPR